MDTSTSPQTAALAYGIQSPLPATHQLISFFGQQGVAVFQFTNDGA